MREFLFGIAEITLGMSLLILLMLIFLKLIGGKFTAKCRYILWTLVMIRLAVPLSFGILPALIEVPVETEPTPVQVQIQVPTVEYTPVPQNPVTIPPQEPAQMPNPSVQSPVYTEPEPKPITWDDVKAYIPYVYLAVAALFLLWNLLSYRMYTAKILRTAREADGGTQEIYEAVCRKKGLSRTPVLLVSPDVNSPAAFGLIRCRIVLPDIDLSENGLAGTLSHEVTHCKRGDLWVKAVCLLARSFHWFNPFVHLAAFRCEMEMELSCDESVLTGCSEETRAAYGEVMLDIIRRCRRNRGALTTHFNPKKNAVKARFTNILYGSGKKRGLWLIAVCLVLCLIAGAIVACRTEEDDIQETLTEPLPDGETVEIPLIYKQYTPELSQDMFVEEIQETELTEILQDQELCGVRVILYLDENELFCAAYERDDTLFRFIRTGGVEPVSYDAEEFSDILEADGFTVSWSWSHRFRTYFTVEDGAPALYLDAYDNVTEADYDNDGVTEVICQNMTNVDIYDISDGTLQTVSFDSELLQPKPGEFYRYLPEKNWFEFDYKKGGEDTLFHRYGTVQDGMLTLVTPDETIDTSETGEFPTMEAYVTDYMSKETTAQYFAAEPDGSFSNKQKTANVTDTKLLRLEKKGELADLAPEGTLECWEYKYLIKLDVPTEKVMIVGGQQEEDGWFDLEGQGNHTTVALRYPDGTYTVLRDAVVADGIDFTGYRNSYEEAIYDWYVTEYGLDLPLYVQDWINEITLTETEIMGNKPVHRFDGDGWGIYIPISTWYQSTDAMENQWLWRSSYNTGSTLMVDVFSHSLEDEYVTAEKQGYTPADSTNRVWENHTDGLHSCYYYYENPISGFWRVTIEWTDEGVTNDNANIVIEPQILKLMAEKFVVFGAANNADNALTVTSPIYLCDDVYRSETTPTHGEGTITFPAGLNGYKLYTCEVLLCGDECDPHDVVYRNYFGYAGGFPLQEMKITQNGSYTTGLWLFTYPDEILEQILSDMEKGGASEKEKQAYRNKRAYLYHMTIDEEHCACIFIEPEDMNVRPENEQEILDAMVASVEINLTLLNPEVELVSYPYTDRVFPVPEYWEEEQIAVLEYSSNTTPAFSFALYEWRAHTEHDTGLVWILSAHTLEEFVETAEFWKNTHDIDVYTQIFSQANYLLGTDTEYAYVLTLPTDVQFLEKDPVSYQQYERLQISSQTVLGWFMEENGITPNPTCPASAVYAPAEETPEGIASAFLNRYLHQVYMYTETAFTEMMDPAYHTPIAYLHDKAQYLSYTRQARGEMAYDFDVEYYNTQSTIPAEKFLSCSIRANIRFRKEPYGEMVNLEERYIVTLRETETGWLVTDMMQENDRFDEMYKASGFDLNALLTEFNTSLAGNPDTIWQTFLDTVVAPYENYIASKEFLDLDGNGINELLLYDLGNGICEIYTIEGGEVKSLYNGTSLLTIYSDTPAILAPPSLGATDDVFYALPMPDSVTAESCKNWFVPCPVSGGYMLYSTYGHLRNRLDQYFYFYSGEDTVIGKVLCVEELSCFKTENNGLTPETIWECWHQGEKVTKDQYFARLEECWDTLEQYYGVTYSEANTLHLLDELRKAPDTSFELLADLLDTLKTEDPQTYISRGLYGEIDPANRYAAWGFSDDKAFAENLAVNYTFEPLTAMEVQETTRITLHSLTEGEWTIHSWVNSNYVELITGGQSYFFRAVYKYNSEQYFGDALKNWFDHAEYAATPYQAVIPDTGQGFLAAAQTFVDSWYNRRLQVSSGSRYAYSYVSCSVRDAENREHLIQNGFIGEDTYTYYITVIFVPENPHAGMESMAGNTGLYTGNDPAVPANAYEFYRIGYITLEEDGWHGEVGGTGW